MNSRRQLIAVAGLALGALALTPACGAAQSAQPYVVRGRVTDERGRPIAGAEIVIDNEFLYNSNVTARSGADGSYRVQLPRVASTWNATASTQRMVGGQIVKMELAPDNEASFAGNQGAVRNFSIRTSGRRADGRSYGGSAIVTTPIMSSVSASTVILTLTPEGGGAPVSGQVQSTGDGYALRDIPIGRYVVTARASTGPVKIRMRNRGAYGRSVTAEFTPVTDTIYHMELEVSE